MLECVCASYDMKLRVISINCCAIPSLNASLLYHTFVVNVLHFVF